MARCFKPCWRSGRNGKGRFTGRGKKTCRGRVCRSRSAKGRFR